MIRYDEEIDRLAVIKTAEAMCAAARTAPKAKGIDYLRTAVLTDEDIVRLSDIMKKQGEETGLGFLLRDAGNVLNSQAVVLIGTSYQQRGLGEFCSLCNFRGCEESKSNGAVCIFDPMDLGIALGSAVSVAADNRVDSRILFSAGKAAVEMGIFPKEINCVMAVPLSASGKSIYFDRK